MFLLNKKKDAENASHSEPSVFPVFFLNKKKDDGVTRGKAEMPVWRGMTIFYQDHPSYDVAGLMFVDSLEGLIPVYLTYHDVQDVSDIFETWNSVPEDVRDDDPHEVYLLKMKASGKELDPMAFNAEEKKEFDAADQAEWMQWIKSNCTRVVPPSEERHMPKV